MGKCADVSAPLTCQQQASPTQWPRAGAWPLTRWTCAGEGKPHILPSRLQELGWDWWSVHSVMQGVLGLLGMCAQHGSCTDSSWVHPATLGHPWSQACHGQGIECMYLYFCFEKPDRKYASPVCRDCSMVKMMGKQMGVFVVGFLLFAVVVYWSPWCILVWGCFSQHTWHTSVCQSDTFL